MHIRELQDPCQAECLNPSQHTRTITEILCSSLITLLLCSSYCIRPNMASSDSSRSRVMMRKLMISLWMLMFPEVVVAWAIRQWYQARVFAKRYEARGWTIAHGHFCLMGGFILFEAERPFQVLTTSKFNKLLQSGCIQFPSISEQDIRRRGTGHPLLAAITILHASWFIAQCIARGVRGLVMTQIEMMTLALLSMYALLLVAWWHKPIDPRDFIRVDLTQIPLPETIHLRPTNIDGDFGRETKRDELVEAIIDLGLPPRSNRDGVRTLWILFSFPCFVFRKLCDHYHQLSFPSGSIIPDGTMEVPLFYSRPLSQPLIAFSFCSMNALGSIFAASHLLPSSPFHFNSREDQLRWLVGASEYTVLPSGLAIVACILIVPITYYAVYLNRMPTLLLKAIRGFILCVPIFGCWMRLGPRLWLFVEALRVLTPDARISVPWTNYIPHFH